MPLSCGGTRTWSSPQTGADAPGHVDGLLREAARRRASDVHVEPVGEGYEVRYRIDGLLETVERFDETIGRSLVARLMVLAQLLTYRLDVPQEGRVTFAMQAKQTPLDLRLAIMPTARGLRAVIRLPAELTQPRTLEDLQLPDAVLAGMKAFAAADAGLLLLVGPAGSGKTTTIYALLEYIHTHSPGLSIVTLEDPVERKLPGVTQIEVTPFGQLTYERALRSIVRQDPQVLMLGEIRDRDTATLAIQAALSGHRLVSTLHAATPGGAIARLLEMGIEPYQITSAAYGVAALRLVRKRKSDVGYEGRVPIGEMATLMPPVRQAILQRADADVLQKLIRAQPQYVTMRQSATALVDRGVTDQSELERVLGANGSETP